MKMQIDPDWVQRISRRCDELGIEEPYMIGPPMSYEDAVREGLLLSEIKLLPEWPLRTVTIAPIDYLMVPKSKRCVRISPTKCEYRAVVRHDCIQLCEPCYLAVVRATMEVYPYYLRSLDDDT